MSDERYAIALTDCVNRLNADGSLKIDDVVEKYPDIERDLREDLRIVLALGMAAEPGGVGEVLGDYRLQRKLSRGGMGVVYEAIQISLGRRVALKLLPPAMARDLRTLARFRHEARIASRLEHPGICPVHDAGVIGGVPFISMPFIEGNTLAQDIENVRKDFGLADDDTHAPTPNLRRGGSYPSAWTKRIVQACRWIESAARSLHEAHEAGLVHRDIKPGNIILASDGRPVILDFGLARSEASDVDSFTRTGEAVGTLPYMSPEQIRADKSGLDRRTDVYSLGVTLYEAITLRRPFSDPTRDSLSRKILREAAADPRRFVREIPQDLRVILATAMEKNPDSRYQTALDLAEDIRRFRRREPIQARPAGPALKFARWAQRNPIVAGVTTGLILVLAAGLAISLVLLHRLATERLAREEALGERIVALEEIRAERDAKIDALERAEGALLLARASALLERNPGQAVALALEGATRAPDPFADSTLLEVLAGTREIRTLVGHQGSATCVAFSPDGRRIATGSTDLTARIWSSETGETVAILTGHRKGVSSVRFSADGSRLMTSSYDGAVRVWDARWGRELLSFQAHGADIDSADLSPDGRWVATAARDRTGAIWDAMTGAPTAKLVGHRDRLLSVRFHPNGERLVTASDDGSVRLWDAESGADLKTIVEEIAGLRFASFGPKGRLLAVTSLDGTIRLYDSEKEALLRSLVGHRGPADKVAFSPDGSTIATSSDDGTIRLWEAETGNPTLVLRGHSFGTAGIAFHPSEPLLVSGGWDSMPRVWNVGARLGVETLVPEDVPATQGLGWEFRRAASPDWSADGLWIAATAADGRARIWSVATGKARSALGDSGDLIVATAFAPDGNTIVTGSRGGALAEWSVPSGTRVHSGRHPQAASAGITSVAYMPDGSGVLVCHEGSSVTLVPIRALDAGSWDELETWEVDGARWVDADPTGARFVVASSDGTAVILERSSGERVAVLRGHEGPLTCARFDERGARIITASEDSTATIWDATSYERIVDLVGHDRASVTGADLSPNGELAATSSRDFTVRIWNASSGEALRSLHLPRKTEVLGLRFSPDSGHVAASTGAGHELVTTLWPVDPVVVARRQQPRRLTPDERRELALDSPEALSSYRSAWELDLHIADLHVFLAMWAADRSNERAYVHYTREVQDVVQRLLSDPNVRDMGRILRVARDALPSIVQGSTPAAGNGSQ